MLDETYLTVDSLSYLPKLQRVIVEAKLSSGAWKQFRHGYIYTEEKEGSQIKIKPIKKNELEALATKSKQIFKVQKGLKKYF